MRLERVQVLVDLLPSQADPRRQRSRRGGRGKLGEESASHRPQGHRRRRRVIDDLDVEHDDMVALTIFLVNDQQRLFLPALRRSGPARRWRVAGMLSFAALAPTGDGTRRVSQSARIAIISRRSASE